jgi:hypothetical protein
MKRLGLDRAELEYVLWDRLLHLYLEGVGKEIIVDKTPSNVLQWERISECWPDARYIFLLRHPGAIVKSASEIHPDWDPLEVEDVVGDFTRAVELARLNLKGVTVKYEELASRPTEITQEICRYLAIPWEKGMLDYGEVDQGAFLRGIGDWGKRIESGKILPARSVPNTPDSLGVISKRWGY